MSDNPAYFNEATARRLIDGVRRFEDSAGGDAPRGVSGYIASQASRFLVKEVFDDYLRCRTFDGTTEGDTDIKVAKPPELRKTPYHGKTIAYTQLGSSFSLSYSYTNAYTRTVTKVAGGTGSETQVIVPAYIGAATGDYKGEQIYAITGVGNGTGVVLNPGTQNEERVNWLDMNVGGRMWAKV